MSDHKEDEVVKKNVKVVSFENEHEAFAASRSSQYVYVPTRDLLFTILDQYAETVEGDVKHPLVILGNDGGGKSAFLANWVMRRREHKHKEEFLFQHFVGCSGRSSSLGQTLFRLEKALKDFFQLREMEVPDSEERLRWSLNRFLAAAAKKYSPARIVIIIDGVNNLKGEDTPRGTLHWLPSELPPCVRFIVSTTEFEKDRGEDDDKPRNLNRTFMELTRRRCPVVPMESLSVNTRHNIINEFISSQPGDLILQESNQFKMVTAPASAQPLFLRTLLQALRLDVALTNMKVEDLLDTFISCSTARELLHKNLNICFGAISDDPAKRDMLGKMLSVLYVSRDGLSEDEVWNLLRMVTGLEPDPQTKIKLLAILKDMTMVVDNTYTFSHEIYREVVYEKYIKSPDALVRWHFKMARFFSQLQPGPRKLNCLPYHLEVAGSWSKVKNCLTDIEMFKRWWTPPFKSDFMKFWASLTAKTKDPSSADSKGGNGNGSVSAELGNPENSRPTFDIVEEYVKSLDEYRTQKHPSEEDVADIILKIAEFLIDFATLGHEAAADVPYSIHPVIPIEDLKAVGVPHLESDKDGRSCLVYPTEYSHLGVPQAPGQDDVGPAEDIPSRSATKAPTDIPIRTAYFFNRWMWIQYPYIALGNCYQRFYDGCAMKDKIDKDSGRGPELPAIGKKKEKGFFKKSFFKDGMSLSKSASMPEIAFTRKAARSFPRATAASQGEFDATQQFNTRMVNLQDSIMNLKEEYDFLCMQNGTLNKRLYALKGSLVDLQRAGESTSQFDGSYAEVSKREKIASEKYDKSLKFHANLANLVLVCDRHPPHMPALITEVENKLDLDADLLQEIKKRLWEQKFEHNTHIVKFKEMKTLVREGVSMHEQLLEFRMQAKKRMQKQAAEDTALLNATKNGDTLKSTKKRLTDREKTDDMGDTQELDKTSELVSKWEQKWEVVAQRTGIDDPSIFFKRMNNRQLLEDQIQMLSKTAETKLEQLKRDSAVVEGELEEVRVEASLLGGHGREIAQKTDELALSQQNLRRQTELTESYEHLQKKGWEGLRHLSEMLGEPVELETLSEGDAASAMSIKECVEVIDKVLEQLIEEKEKLETLGSTESGMGSTLGSTTKDINPESPPLLHKNAELVHVLDWMESPKARLPQTIPSRKTDLDDPNDATTDFNVEENEDEKEGMWNRNFAKTKLLKDSMKFIREDERKKKEAEEITAL